MCVIHIYLQGGIYVYEYVSIYLYFSTVTFYTLISSGSLLQHCAANGLLKYFIAAAGDLIYLASWIFQAIINFFIFHQANNKCGSQQEQRQQKITSKQKFLCALSHSWIVHTQKIILNV
jgi:hypothetical protein